MTVTTLYTPEQAAARHRARAAQPRQDRRAKIKTKPALFPSTKSYNWDGRRDWRTDQTRSRRAKARTNTRRAERLAKKELIA